MPVHLSRSRPLHKNDNRFVDQKNSTLVRAFFGPWRIDIRARCERLNRLYDQMRIYYNLFLPVLHLVGKRMEDGRQQRKWNESKTPFERLLATGILSPHVADRLKQLRADTNPRELRRWVRDEPSAIYDEVANAAEPRTMFLSENSH
jgi:hypothetical protein